MEQVTQSALERIENPILLLLLVVLIGFNILQWRKNNEVTDRMFSLAMEAVGAIKDVTNALENNQGATVSKNEEN